MMFRRTFVTRCGEKENGIVCSSSCNQFKTSAAKMKTLIPVVCCQDNKLRHAVEKKCEMIYVSIR